MLKKITFDNCLRVVSEKTEIPTDNILAKDKSRLVSDARHLFFYTCNEAGVTPAYVREYVKLYTVESTLLRQVLLSMASNASSV